jgi:ABC-type transport system involved in cytochrome bd biosynthesis fused ATPase/permease subunit
MTDKLPGTIASYPYPLPGQRIVARLRERTYAAALRQEVEFVERGEGDVLSRLSVDTSIVGERLLRLHNPCCFVFMCHQCYSESIGWFTLNCHVIRWL